MSTKKRQHKMATIEGFADYWPDAGFEDLKQVAIAIGCKGASERTLRRLDSAQFVRESSTRVIRFHLNKLRKKAGLSPIPISSIVKMNGKG